MRIKLFSILVALIFSSGMLCGETYHRVIYGDGNWNETDAWDTVPGTTPVTIPSTGDSVILDNVAYAGDLFLNAEQIDELTVNGTGWGLTGTSLTAYSVTINSNSSLTSSVNLSVQGLILNSGSLLRFDTNKLNIAGQVLTVNFQEGDEKIKLDLMNFDADFADMAVGESRQVLGFTVFFGGSGVGANDIFELQNAPSGYEFVIDAQGLSLIAIPEASTYAGLVGVSFLGLAFLRRRR